MTSAKVFFVHWIHGSHPDSSLKPLTVTDAKGWFDFTSPQPATESPVDKKWLSAPIVASAAGYGPAVAESVDFETTGELKKQLPAAALSDLQRRLGDQQPVLKLVKDDVPITGRVVNTEGNPVAGVRLRVNELWLNPQGNLDQWETAAKDAKADFILLRSKAPAGMNGPQLPAIVSDVQTDGDGRFTLPGVGQSALRSSWSVRPASNRSLVWARTRTGEKITVPLRRGVPKGLRSGRLESRKVEETIYPAEVTHVTAQSRPVVGTITDADTGQPIAGVLVSDGQDSSNVVIAGDKKYIYAVTDAKGHYRLDGLVADSPEEVIVDPPSSTPYLPVGEKVTVLLNAPELKLDFQLHKGIWVRGRVIDRAQACQFPARCSIWQTLMIRKSKVRIRASSAVVSCQSSMSAAPMARAVSPLPCRHAAE